MRGLSKNVATPCQILQKCTTLKYSTCNHLNFLRAHSLLALVTGMESQNSTWSCLLYMDVGRRGSLDIGQSYYYVPDVTYVERRQRRSIISFCIVGRQINYGRISIYGKHVGYAKENTWILTCWNIYGNLSSQQERWGLSQLVTGGQFGKKKIKVSLKINTVLYKSWRWSV